MGAEEAFAIGLVNRIDPDPEAAAITYFETQLAPRSSAALRLAVRAARSELATRIRARFAIVEQLYLQELMRTHDAIEGLNSFIEKRQPHWAHR